MKKIVLLLLIITPLFCFSARIRDIEFSIDSSSFGVENSFQISVNLIKKNGKRIHLKPNVFSFQWSKVKVKGENILSFNNGVIIFDQTKITKDNYQTKILVSYDMGRKGKHLLEKTINLPYITDIQIINKHLKVNTPESIQYLLTFNNGKSTLSSQSLFSSDNISLKGDTNLVLSQNTFYLKLSDPAEFDSLLIFGSSASNPEFNFKKWLPLLYPSNAIIYGSGKDGVSGRNGINGRKYSKSGSNGFAGKSGGNADNVKVFIDIIERDEKVFFKINSIFSNKPHQSDLIEFKGLPIEIFANGGIGGNGGNGGNGQDGRIDLEEKIISPKGGNGGDAGNAGNGGNGGSIELFFKKTEKDYTHYFIAFNYGGKKGIPGKGGLAGRGDYLNAAAKDKAAKILDGNTGINGKSGRDGFNGPIISKSYLLKDDFQKALDKQFK